MKAVLYYVLVAVLLLAGTGLTILTNNGILKLSKPYIVQ